MKRNFGALSYTKQREINRSMKTVKKVEMRAKRLKEIEEERNRA